MQQVEEAVTLYVEYKVKFFRILVGQRMASLNSGRVQQNVDAATALTDLGDYLRDCFDIGKVDAEVVRSATGCLNRIDGGLCGLRPLEACEFLLYESRGRALSTILNTSE